MTDTHVVSLNHELRERSSIKKYAQGLNYYSNHSLSLQDAFDLNVVIYLNPNIMDKVPVLKLESLDACNC